MLNFSSALYQILGERIKKRREELHLSQTELSEKIKLGRTSISNIEKGRQQPPLAIIYDICFALDIDIHLILPTYQEIDARKDFSDIVIEDYINNFDADENTIKQLRSIIKKNTK